MSYKITNDCICCGTCLEQCKVDLIVQGGELYEITDACTSIALIHMPCRCNR